MRTLVTNTPGWIQRSPSSATLSLNAVMLAFVKHCHDTKGIRDFPSPEYATRTWQSFLQAAKSSLGPEFPEPEWFDVADATIAFAGHGCGHGNRWILSNPHINQGAEVLSQESLDRMLEIAKRTEGFFLHPVG